MVPTAAASTPTKNILVPATATIAAAAAAAAPATPKKLPASRDRRVRLRSRLGGGIGLEARCEGFGGSGPGLNRGLFQVKSGGCAVRFFRHVLTRCSMAISTPGPKLE